MKRFLIEIRGIVQGVGFRPFVAREAGALGLSGFVQNTAYGVLIDCQGPEAACRELIRRIKDQAPPGTMLFSLDAAEAPVQAPGLPFAIRASHCGAPQAAVSPDLGICADCEAELLTPGDRRYRYPFINCTHCGPRFSILRRVPYDRANTSMAAFSMCADCEREYHDMEDRRFHAQPDACASCGPRLSWLEPEGERTADPIARFGQSIAEGKIVAVKGLGGFHLACDPYNGHSVELLRLRKRRDEKPFALMARSLAAAAAICEIDQNEAQELCSPRRPVVLLRRRKDCALPEAIAPGLDRLGVMLAYTPLHVLLAEENPLLVMTSANHSEEPMLYRDEDIEGLWPLCDAILTHDRPILRRVDDSVCVFHAKGRQLSRRARGFAPQPLPLRLSGAAGPLPQVLAFGGQLKNTFCVLREERAYLSSHIGDLDDARAWDFYQSEIPVFLDLLGAAPEILAADPHPGYAATQAAQEYAAAHPEAKLVWVQHHRAHFASVLAEHGLEKALGFIFDGTGYGEDGRLWGGEVFCGSITGAARIGTLLPLVLFGGEAAIRQPWRIGLYAVATACGAEEALSLFGEYPDAKALLSLASPGPGPSSPLSSGMGRLFDAFAAIAGLGHAIAYEGQAAIALEQAYDAGAEGRYRLDIQKEGSLLVFDWREAVRAAVKDRLSGAGAGTISARFHRALIHLLEEVAGLYPNLPIALSGGVFQNLRLLEGAAAALGNMGRRVYTNEAVPPNDGGLSYGQAAYAAALYKEG